MRSSLFCGAIVVAAAFLGCAGDPPPSAPIGALPPPPSAHPSPDPPPAIPPGIGKEDAGITAHDAAADAEAGAADLK